jgi:hypothetical protein
MNSLVQFPQEILLIIIALCDGISVENLKCTSKAFNRWALMYINNASFQELTCKVIPVHIYSDYYGVKYHTHFHQLLNGKLHGKLEIYKLYEFHYKIYNRIWFADGTITYRGFCFGYRRFDPYNPFSQEEMFKLIYNLIKHIRENADERTIGIKRKRGQYH